MARGQEKPLRCAWEDLSGQVMFARSDLICRRKTRFQPLSRLEPVEMEWYISFVLGQYVYMLFTPGHSMWPVSWSDFSHMCSYSVLKCVFGQPDWNPITCGESVQLRCSSCVLFCTTDNEPHLLKLKVCCSETVNNEKVRWAKGLVQN